MAEHDIVILGAGPAGISAAIWAHTLELDYVVVDAGPAPGGQLHRVFNRIVDYPGLIAANGAELAEHFLEHLRKLSALVQSDVTVNSIDVAGRTVGTSAGDLCGRHLLLATGVRRRTLGVPGEGEFVGRGVSPSASKYAGQYAGRDVLVVGGGDAAFEEALILSAVCRRVTLVHRTDRFLARPAFQERVREASNIVLETNATLEAIEGADEVERAIVVCGAERMVLEVSGVFVCVGIEPNSDLVRGQIALDSRGYAVVDHLQRCSIGTMYAAGDVCTGSSLTIAAAVGQGAAVAKDVQRRLRSAPK